MDASFNTPLRGAQSGGSFFATTPNYRAAATGSQPAHSPAGDPSDRYIAARSAQDTTLSHFLLTSKENMAPMLLLSHGSPLRDDSMPPNSVSRAGSPAPVQPAATFSTPPPLPPTLGQSSFVYTPQSSARLPGSPVGSPDARRGESAMRGWASTAAAAVATSPSRGASPSLADMLAKMHLDGSAGRMSDGSNSPRNGSMMAATLLASSAAKAGSPQPAYGSPMDIEPYTTKLARTLFSDTPQTTVLGLHNTATGNSSGNYTAGDNANVAATSMMDGAMTNEEARYHSSLGVVFEHNRARNFKSSSFRVIAQTPERILDAADLIDDFYLNLIDWSSTDILCVALANFVYLWEAATCKITRLPSSRSSTSAVCAVQWAADGTHLAVGLQDGCVEVWDVEAQKVVQRWQHHLARVGSLNWCGYGSVLTSGSKDATIRLQDLRDPSFAGVLRGHQQEVCGLKWSPTALYLASGGNDNQLLIWDRRLLMSNASSSPMTGGPSSGRAGGRAGSGERMSDVQPVLYLNQHTAAVKALSWNPMQPSLLVSGGGTDDKTLRFWNTLTGDCVHQVNTQSQVCGVLWSLSGSELVSSHGFSLNQLTIWKYPSLRRVADLRGHTSRVLHLCLSHDGEVVVSAAGDETIRFWRCFPPVGQGGVDSHSAFHPRSILHAGGPTAMTGAGVSARTTQRSPPGSLFLTPPPPLCVGGAEGGGAYMSPAVATRLFRSPDPRRAVSMSSYEDPYCNTELTLR